MTVRYVFFTHHASAPPPPVPPGAPALLYFFLRKKRVAPTEPGAPPLLYFFLRHARPSLPGASPLLYFFMHPPNVSVDLLESLAKALNANSNLAAQVPGQFWADSAPDGVTFPYGVIIEVGEAAGYSSQDATGVHPYIDDGQIQISLFVEGAKSLARTLGQKVENALNDATLTFSNGYLMNLRRRHRMSVLDPTKGPNGGDVWNRAITFDTTVGRTL